MKLIYVEKWKYVFDDGDMYLEYFPEGTVMSCTNTLFKKDLMYKAVKAIPQEQYVKDLLAGHPVALYIRKHGLRRKHDRQHC